MNEKCIPLTKTPCKDAFKIFLKNKQLKHNVVYNDEQEKFLWEVWRMAWVFGKQYGAIHERKILINNGRTNCKPLLTDAQMKEIWNRSNPQTGKEFGRSIEIYYGIRRAHDQLRPMETCNT
jgi:hypothetical protein